MSREKIATILKQNRATAKLSVKEVVDRLKQVGIEVSNKTVYGWENGHSQPDADTFLILCDIYEVSDIMNTFGYSGRREESPDQLEQHIVKLFRQLNSEGKQAAIAAVQGFCIMAKYVNREDEGAATLEQTV